MRAGRTKCTPMAPVSGPLTHGVAATQPSEIATLMSVNRSVASCTFSIRGEFVAMALSGSCTARSVQIAGSFGFLNETFMDFSLAKVRGQLLVEIRIEDTDLGDALDGKLVATCRPANGLRRGPVVHTESLLLVRAHVRVNP